jgi:23S rRNA pseudouridine955/2504/2580 synthase
MEKTYFIDDDYNNTRLDRWFKRKVCEVPQSIIEKSIRKGKIKVNGKKTKSSYKLKLNDKILLKDINLKANQHKKITLKYTATKKDLSLSSSLFIENNENFVVINKPSGIAVQSGTKSRKNIIDILKDTKEFQGYLPYTVHRIDKETTGILIVAKNRKYAQLFTSLFRIRKIHKTYLGLTLGSFEKSKGTLKDELFHYEGDKKVKTIAITHYKVLDSNNNYTLLKLNPETGRKHQLRKQLLIHGNPILGDTKYRLTQNRQKTNNNLMLHAYKINFSISNTKYNYSAELPPIFKDYLKEKYLKIY